MAETTVKRPASAPPEKPKAAKKQKEKDPNRIGLFYGRGRIDIPMLIITLVLLILGITMMFSASHALSYRDNEGDSYGYAYQQIMWAGIGLLLMFVASFVDYRFLTLETKVRLFKWDVPLSVSHLVFGVALIPMLLIIPLGQSNTPDGPRRWLPLFGGRTFQPSDILKFALIIFFAYYIAANAKKMRNFVNGLFIPGCYLLVVVALMAYQPHLSGLVIMLAIVVAMLFIGGTNWVELLIVGAAGVAAIMFYFLVLSDFTYFVTRLQYTFNPLADIGTDTYQTYQSVLAIGSGGLWGVGFGNSTQKYYYLPDAENDFVFSILCEEFGLIGGALVIILFLIFVFRGFYIASKAGDRFGTMLATGVALQVGIQSLLNIGVTCSCIPNTGVSLPFFSYGGTALVIQLVEVGLLLAVSRRAKLD